MIFPPAVSPFRNMQRFSKNKKKKFFLIFDFSKLKFYENVNKEFIKLKEMKALKRGSFMPNLKGGKEGTVKIVEKTKGNIDIS